jgi:ABC-type multidrug transport system ATPase subunit
MGQAAMVTKAAPAGLAASFRDPVAQPAVRISGFRKTYGRVEAARGIDLDVRPGELFGLIGPDGAGKSSLMKAVAGVLSFEGGTVDVLGTRVATERDAERVKGRLGFMPQGLGLNLYPNLSIEENVDFFARLRLIPEEVLAERKRRLLEITRLASFRDRPMKQLSGGMKQKLGLICSLIYEPELLILDEPTTGVDPVSRRDFWVILGEQLRQRGTTALVSTAYMDEATRFDRVALLFGGRVLAQGTPEEILARVPGTLVTVRAEPQAEALARLKARFPQVEATGPRLSVYVERVAHDEAAQRVEEALAGVTVADVQTVEPDLEDAFVALLRREKLVDELGSLPASSGPTPSSGPAALGSAPGSKTAILADGLIRQFGAFRAVDGVSFRVSPGEIFGLLGANGAGKTTVIKMLTGILPPTGGTGFVAGVDMRRAGRAIKERIGYMSQAFSLYQDLTVAENIRLYAGIYGLGQGIARERTDWIIRMAGLGGHERDLAGSLPMGVRQRLALGCALVHRPRILFLDEPTSGVDPIGRRRFWEILVHLARQDRVAILITTHYMSEAEQCDHLALLFAGRVVADATPTEMKALVEADAGHPLEVVVDRPAEALEIIKSKGFKAADLFGSRIHLPAHDPSEAEKTISSALASGGIRLIRIAPRTLSMEDVFVYRVRALERQQEVSP